MTVKQPHLSHPKYRPDIDGLRAVAVLAVVAFHAFPSWVRGGFIGVDVFFVISGYLISTIILDNLDKGTFSFTEFYARRIKRIFPALLLVLIACFAFGWFTLLADEYKQLGKHIAAGAGFISNFSLWNEAGYFDNSAETKPLLHLWSLGIEEQFYIVWPLLLWFAWKRKFNLLTITIVVAIASFVLNIKGIKHDMVATFYSPQTRFWELLSGSLLAWITLYKKDNFANVKLKLDYWLSLIVHSEKQEADGKTLLNVLSFIGLLLLVYGFWRINKELSFPGKWALLPVLGAVLIITAGSKAWVNRTILSNKVAVWFGLISFPLYLWHWSILSFARIVESEVPSRNIRIAAVVLSIALAWLTYKLVERPLRFGNHSKAKVTVLVLLMASIGASGFYLFNKNGFEESLKIKVMPKGFVGKSEHAFQTFYEGKSAELRYVNLLNVGSASCNCDPNLLIDKSNGLVKFTPNSPGWCKFKITSTDGMGLLNDSVFIQQIPIPFIVVDGASDRTVSVGRLSNSKKISFKAVHPDMPNFNYTIENMDVKLVGLKDGVKTISGGTIELTSDQIAQLQYVVVDKFSIQTQIKPIQFQEPLVIQIKR